jgi:hypothetical protein
MMSAALALMNSRSWMALGWALVHSLWAGTLVAVLVGLARWALRSTEPRRRYAIALEGFGLIFLSLVGGVPVAFERPAAPATNTPPWETATAIGGGPLLLGADSSLTTMPAPQMVDLDEVESILLALDSELATKPALQASDERFAPLLSRTAPPDPAGPFRPLVSLVRFLPWFWLLGLGFAGLRLAVGTVLAYWLYRPRPVPARVGQALDAMCRSLAHSLGIARPVTVGLCDRIDSPIVLGAFRPRILLPDALMRGWSRERIKLVLLHELAHIRRRDLLVNLAQRLIEAPLFFNPAAWLVSGWVRLEREHCCDRMVVERTGAVRSYAEVLLVLATRRNALGNAALMGEPHLVRRVRRIVEVNLPPRRSRAGLAAAAAAALMGFLPAGAAPVASNVCLSAIPATVPGPPAPLEFEIELRKNWIADMELVIGDTAKKLSIVMDKLPGGPITESQEQLLAEATQLSDRRAHLQKRESALVLDLHQVETYLDMVHHTAAIADLSLAHSAAFRRVDKTIQDLEERIRQLEADTTKSQGPTRISP